ncbi:cornifelin-like [Haliotis rufescens]|uniref:cornifelin-like n=1 Tax=Haliotis rufescens TaxID=6454 RepID=UPI001EAF9219|nr:cornifelin-like [Haliotis rufescens]
MTNFTDNQFDPQCARELITVGNMANNYVSAQPQPMGMPMNQPVGMPNQGQPMGMPNYGQPMGMPMAQPVAMPMIQPTLNNQSNTTVVVNSQPGSGSDKSSRPWSSGLCGCCDNFGICVTVMMCPACYACHLAGKSGEFCCLPLLVPGWMIALRAYVRGRHRISGTICDDCLKVTCCFQLAMCQLSREIDFIKDGKTAL